MIVDDQRLPRALVALLALVAIIELAVPFFVKSIGVDGPGQLNLEIQFNSLIARGVFVPRWVPEGFQNFGSPAFYFYPPVAFYLTALLQQVTRIANPWTLFQIAGLLGTIASFFSARYLFTVLGATGSRRTAGSLLYALAPYRIAELYTRSSLSSHIGYAIMPLVWCGIILIFNNDEQTKWKGVAITAIAGALLFLTNVPLTMLTAVGVVIVGIALYRQVTVKGLLYLAGAVVICLLLVSYQLVSIIAYQRFAQLGHLMTNREFLLYDLLHLRNLPGLFHAGILWMAVGMIAYTSMLAKRSGDFGKERLILRAGFAIAIVILFLEFAPISAPLWDSFVVLQLIQGSWRFYILFVLFTAAFVALANTQRHFAAAKLILWTWGIASIPLALLLLFNVHLTPHHEGPLLDEKEYAPVYTLKDRDTLNQTLSLAAASFAQGWFGPGERGQVRRTASNPSSDEYSVTIPVSEAVRFPRFYWPSWRLAIDSQPVLSHPDSLGFATAVLPQGSHVARWTQTKTPIEQAGMWISSITASVGILALGVGWMQRRRKSEEAIESAST